VAREHVDAHRVGARVVEELDLARTWLVKLVDITKLG